MHDADGAVRRVNGDRPDCHHREVEPSEGRARRRRVALRRDFGRGGPPAGPVRARGGQSRVEALVGSAAQARRAVPYGPRTAEFRLSCGYQIRKPGIASWGCGRTHLRAGTLRSRTGTYAMPVSAARLTFRAMTSARCSRPERISCRSSPSMQMTRLPRPNACSPSAVKPLWLMIRPRDQLAYSSTLPLKARRVATSTWAFLHLASSR